MLNVTANNDFHEGWLLYILGQPMPEPNPEAAGPRIVINDEPIDWSTVAADGWRMASESGLTGLRQVTEKMTELGQIVVERS